MGKANHEGAPPMAWDSSHMGLGFRTSRLEGQLVGKHMLGFRE